MWRARPVFISSTFLDMQAERDHLRSYVFPELEERLRACRQNLEWVDLRMGVATTSLEDEDARELHVLKVCLGEVRRCRPFLIVLLGDRYGWVPPVDRAQAAAQEEGFDCDLVGRSVTDLEIEYGVLRDPDQQHRSMFYFRKPLPYAQMPQDIAAFYSDANDLDPAAADRAKRLAVLKQRIERELPGRVRHYSVDWDSEHGRIKGLEAWGRRVLEDIWTELQPEIGSADVEEDLPWQEVQRAAIEDFIEDRARDFVGREPVLAELIAHAVSESKEGGVWGVCLTGESGTGKSAIFGELTRRLRQMDVVVLVHAANPRWPSVDPMLYRWIRELALQLGIDTDIPEGADRSAIDAVFQWIRKLTVQLGIDTNLPEGAFREAIDAAFQSLLGRLASQRRVVVLVDALDQFEATTRGRFATWIPRPWPLNARLIMTAVPGEASRAVSKFPGVEMLPLKPLDADEARAIADGICARYHRKLEPDVLDALIAKKNADGFAWDTPLWLVLAVEELNLLDADDFSRAKRTYKGSPADQLKALMLDMVAAMPPDIPTLYYSTFSRVQELFGPFLTRAFLGSIAVSRAGWRETDFRRLLPRLSDETWDELRFASLRRLFRGQIRQDGGFGRWDFTHRLMRAAVKLFLAEQVHFDAIFANHLLSRSADDSLAKYYLESQHSSEADFHAIIADHLLSLGPDDPLRQTETMLHLLDSENWARAAAYYGDQSLSQEELNGATSVLAGSVLTIGDNNDAVGAKPIIQLIDAIDQAEVGTTESAFNVASRLLFALNELVEKQAPLATLAAINGRVLSTLERCAKADPSNESAELFLSQSHMTLGDVLRDQGDLAAALENYNASLAIRDRLAKADPTDDIKILLSFTHDQIGDVLFAQGDLSGAFDSYKTALAIKDRLVRTDPIVQRELSVSHNKTGDVLRFQGSLAAALDNYRASLAIREKLAKAKPSDEIAQRDLSVAQQQVGDTLLEQGEVSAALDSFKTSLAIADRLVKSDPSNTVAQRDLSCSLDKIGDVLLVRGDLSAALDNYRAAHEIRDRLAKADPGNAKWQRDTYVSQEKIGQALFEQGNLAAALESYMAALAIVDRFSKSGDSKALWQGDCALLHAHIGDVFANQGDLTAALDSFKVSLAVREALVQVDASNARVQHDLWLTQYRIGDVLNKLDRFEEALAAYRAGLRTHERLVASDPANALNAQTQHDLYVCYEKIGAVLSKLGRADEAINMFDKSLSIQEKLAAESAKTSVGVSQ